MPVQSVAGDVTDGCLQRNGIFLVGERQIIRIPSQVFICQDEVGALCRGPNIWGWFAHIKKRDHSSQLKGKHRLCAVICIITLEYNCMRILDVIDSHVIHTALHRAKQMVQQVWDVDRLVNDQVKLLATDGGA